MLHIMKCTKCKKYSLKELCCKKQTVRAIPLRYTTKQSIVKTRRKNERSKQT